MTPEGHNPSAGTGSQSEVAEELKQDAVRLKDSVGTRAKQEAESRKGQAVHVAGSASTALNTVADDLRANPEVPDWMASALQQAAQKIEGLANHIDGRNVDELGQEVAEFARRNPGTFLAASAAAGFAAARVLRAGADKKRHDREGTGSMQSGQAAPGMQGTQGLYAGQANWPADENVRPTGTGDFESAYLLEDSGIGSKAR